MRLILLGAPGSGKGTMAALLVREFQIPHISTGDIFRQNIKDRTALGLEAEVYIHKGALVPDEVTIAMVADRLSQDDCQRGFLLDGFPRTVPQAEALDKILTERDLPLQAVIDLQVSDELIMARLSDRRVCSKCGQTYNLSSLRPKVENICDTCGGALFQRDDDMPETIRKRLENYYKQTKPVSDFYAKRGLVDAIDNNGEVGSSLPAILKALRARVK
jgi:adenylate kinase